ncbi:MAG TPA: dTDP-4-dehydrorhamnose 3,5-epimerase [Candidatus Ozemobacteraceae bacterium]|nr:dTDP-4-dehydrorhamnose 3,5-epimerase [Candidatus Ozemobacteraceae bacterium]
MKFSPTVVPDVILIEPDVFNDPRGFFMETFHQGKFAAAGIRDHFIQHNHARSAKGILRGLHFQHPKAQGKLIRVIAGEVFDVAVDIRPESQTFGQWVAETLSADNRRLLYIPPGFAHGYCVTSEFAEVVYCCTELYAPEFEGGLSWNDPDLKISWPVQNPILSGKDQKQPRLRDLFPLKFDRP